MSTVLASLQHILRRTDIRCITLATPGCYYPLSHIRFEGLCGSLEITTWGEYNHIQLQDILFGPDGVLFSHSPRIENVTELHIVGCSFYSGQELDHISKAMPNLASISLFHCDRTSLLLAPHNPSSPPFPRLERAMVLRLELRLEEMARARRDLGVPLKTLIVGRGPWGSGYNSLGPDYTVIAGLVEDLRIGCPVEILEWGTRNEIHNIWSTIKGSEPLVSLTDHLVVPILSYPAAPFRKPVHSDYFLSI